MWVLIICLIALVVILLSQWLQKWLNPKCNGRLSVQVVPLLLSFQTFQTHRLVYNVFKIELIIEVEKLCNCSNSLWERTIDGVGVLVGHRRQFQCDVGGEPQGAAATGGWGWGWLLKVGEAKG
ncbi:hypothetical protein CK203_032862 [Vitis vinifera]|uniref:Uncharacterized protein n=1 Tax=Vitis vinifera TaxID=29760 RepID=A0A438HL96_VITVI|nr:hypothetical protein CK203_032862 [Vitis vinifera]